VAAGGQTLTVWNKVDLAAARPAPRGAHPVSAVTGAGLAELAQAVEAALGLGAPAGLEGGSVRWLFERHRDAIARADARLREAGRLLAEEGPLDLVAEEVRASLAALDDLSGRSSAEDVLDRIFARFCLGK
jgi:tRNA modification GTPase